MHPLSTRSRSRRAGFTLVELMVALTGGLIVSIVVFMLARDASRFYKSETRTADATLAGMVGFTRLQNDIARASFMASPNVRRDPSVCGDPVGDASWPTELKHMAGLRIGSSPSNPTLKANGLAPDSITLAGSFSSVEEFPIWGVQPNGKGYKVALQTQIGPLARMGFNASTANAQTQLEMLSSVFGKGRALRIVDRSGKAQYGTISGVTASPPQVLLDNTPALKLRTSSSTICGIRANETGYVNVVNFVKYEVKSLKGNANYAPLYSDAGATPWDADRTELVRSEIDTQGQPIANTEEVVAEYAVNLKFGLTVISGTILNKTDPTLTTLSPGDTSNILKYAGDTTGISSPLFGPQRVRAVRVRLSVRSREADRKNNVTAGGTIAPGLYRIGLGPSGSAPFARVRTLQADVSLPNQMGDLW